MKTSKILNVILALALLVLIIKSTFISPSIQSDSFDVTDTIKKDAIENIMERKSVRSYLDKEVEEDKIETMLKAGMSAPSGKDLRPWSFVVVKDKAVLEHWAEVMPKNAGFLKNTRQAIVVCGDSDKSHYWYLDCSAATQNILLAAEALDLGAVWIGIYTYDDRTNFMQKSLNLPSNIVPLCIIPFGYPSASQMPKDKYDPSLIHREKFIEK